MFHCWLICDDLPLINTEFPFFIPMANLMLDVRESVIELWGKTDLPIHYTSLQQTVDFTVFYPAFFKDKLFSAKRLIIKRTDMTFLGKLSLTPQSNVRTNILIFWFPNGRQWIVLTILLPLLPSLLKWKKVVFEWIP